MGLIKWILVILAILILLWFFAPGIYHKIADVAKQGVVSVKELFNSGNETNVMGNHTPTSVTISGQIEIKR